MNVEEPMSELPNSEQERQTERFLKSNGPPADAFHPDVPDYALEGATKREKYLLEMASISAKQNGWLIQDSIGLKSVHRTINTRLNEIDARLCEGDKQFAAINDDRLKLQAWRDRWLSRKKVVRNVAVAIVTALFLTFLPALAVEWVKHHFHWQ